MHAVNKKQSIHVMLTFELYQVADMETPISGKTNQGILKLIFWLVP